MYASSPTRVSLAGRDSPCTFRSKGERSPGKTKKYKKGLKNLEKIEKGLRKVAIGYNTCSGK
jgi:hypothetical protein